MPSEDIGHSGTVAYPVQFIDAKFRTYACWIRRLRGNDRGVEADSVWGCFGRLHGGIGAVRMRGVVDFWADLAVEVLILALLSGF